MIEKLIGIALLCMIVVTIPVIGFGGFAIFSELTADRYGIRKDQWACDKTEPTRVLMMTGKVPIWSTRDECVVYRKVRQ